MAGKLEGKVAFITGVARGQGRSHALRLAQEGADIIGVDICSQIDTVPYPMSTPDDLAETIRQVEALDRRIHAVEADVRDRAALQAAVDAGVAALGPIDIVLANAGIAPLSVDPSPQEWQDVVDVNLTGVYHTIEVVKKAMIDRGAGGAIVITSSTAGLNGIGGDTPGMLGYTAAKHGVVGLMRLYANQLAPHSIRVNTVHPTGGEHADGRQRGDAGIPRAGPFAEQRDGQCPPGPHDRGRRYSRTRILYLVSDDGRYVTGVTLPVDGGFTNKK